MTTFTVPAPCPCGEILRVPLMRADTPHPSLVADVQSAVDSHCAESPELHGGGE